MKWMSSLKRISFFVILAHLSLFLFIKPVAKPIVLAQSAIKVRSIQLKKKKKATQVPSVWGKIEALSKVPRTPLEVPSEEVHLASSQNEDPTEVIFVTLQEQIELPKNSFVKLTFSTDDRGCISHLVIDECPEDENATYIHHLLKGMPLKYKNLGPITVTLRGIE